MPNIPVYKKIIKVNNSIGEFSSRSQKPSFSVDGKTKRSPIIIVNIMGVIKIINITLLETLYEEENIFNIFYRFINKVNVIVFIYKNKLRDNF
ncbi:hypothetical protein GCM10022396_24850 [Flavivirga amylovorans]